MNLIPIAGSVSSIDNTDQSKNSTQYIVKEEDEDDEEEAKANCKGAAGQIPELHLMNLNETSTSS
jgi:hypothetical protein